MGDDNQLGDQLWGQHGDQLGGQLGNQLGGQFGDQLEDRLHPGPQLQLDVPLAGASIIMLSIKSLLTIVSMLHYRC